MNGWKNFEAVSTPFQFSILLLREIIYFISHKIKASVSSQFWNAVSYMHEILFHLYFRCCGCFMVPFGRERLSYRLIQINFGFSFEEWPENSYPFPRMWTKQEHAPICSSSTKNNQQLWKSFSFAQNITQGRKLAGIASVN